MSDDAVATDAEPEKKRRFTLPSAYTILFALIVMAAIATWIIPAGAYDLNEVGEPIPGTYQEVEAKPSRIVVDSLTARRSTACTASRTPRGTSTTTTRARSSARSTSRCSSS